jgi:hypothetical protein
VRAGSSFGTRPYATAAESIDSIATIPVVLGSTSKRPRASDLRRLSCLMAGLFAAHVRPVVQGRLDNEPQLFVLKFGIGARKAPSRAFVSRQ